MLIKFNSLLTYRKLKLICKINGIKYVSNCNKSQIIHKINSHKTAAYIQRRFRKGLMKNESCPISHEKITYPFISIKLGTFFFYYDFATFIKYLKAYSKINVNLTKKFEGDLEGKINAALKDGQSRAKDLKQNMQSVEGDDSLAEILRTSSIVEPVFIQGLKQVINEVTSGKLKFK